MSDVAALQAKLGRLTRMDESEALAALLPAATLHASIREAVRADARSLLEAVRASDSQGWVDRFMAEYSLDSDEGIALLALAEAYLRIPDAHTADLLIRDKLSGRDWEAHKGESNSPLVNTATFGLVLAKAMVGAQGNAGALRKLLARTSEPFVRGAVTAAMRIMGEQFVLGRDIAEALERAVARENRIYRFSFDMLGEAARTAIDAERYLEAYSAAVRIVGGGIGSQTPIHERPSISVKLSALHPRYEEAQAQSCRPALIERVGALAAEAASLGIGLTIDAEESERLELSCDIVAGVAAMSGLNGWDGLGLAVQAYSKRGRAMIDWVDALARQTGRVITVRLVKGAYWDSEIKRAQERGLAGYPLFTRKAATDVSYLACARAMLDSPHLYPAFATHNALTVATIAHWAGGRRDFEFQRLHGMGAGLYEHLVRERGFPCRVYAPVGGHKDLLAYLVRRLLENGANSSFVHQAADPSVPIDSLLEDPADEMRRVKLRPHAGIPLPVDLYGPERRNSSGIDLADRRTLEQLRADLATAWARPWSAAPIIAGKAVAGTTEPLRNPADHRQIIGGVVNAVARDVRRAIDIASSAAPGWARQPVEARAACLDRLADLMESNRARLMALAIREAGKTIPDALGEVREAVDFCRYYAARAREQFQPLALPGPTGERNSLKLVGRGVFACISPWNFPLAIFTGQVAAALVAGNAVIAKPAPQTPLIAAAAIGLMLEAGVPADVIHLLPGDGAVGQAIVADARINGVAFTGSTATARRIARALLEDDGRPIAPLIAETGGINAMILDSTALPEQAVADIVASAFQSAGQRCSALRLLLVQEDVADRTLEMLTGAMEMLRLGDPADIATDIGPVIDSAARQRLVRHVEAHRDTLDYALPLDEALGFGSFIAPCIIRLADPASLREEVFGPVLHVATWRAGDLDGVIERIATSGYGLTLGVHSRLESVHAAVEARAAVGNLYINRSMIGAVVGVQPFGGEGLSGTGPKAGGPHYLHRFATERTLSIDTTSAGGNATLLSLDEGS